LVIGMISFDILVQGSQNLKAKRSCVKSLIHKVRNRFNVSAAEVGYHDLWNRSKIGIAVVGNDREIVGKVADKVTEFIYSAKDVEVIGNEMEILRY